MIPDQDKTKEQLIAELAELRRKVNHVQQTENAQQKSELRLSAIAQALIDPVIITDEDGKIIFWTPAAEKTFGYTADEVTGKNAEILRPEQFRSDARARRELFLTTGNTLFIGRAVEEVALKKNGEVFPAEVTTICWKENDRFHFCGIVRDISKRKQAEAALRESEAQYRELVESANSAILRFDTQGRITFCNKFTELLFGYSREELVGQSAGNTILPEIDSSGRNLATMLNDVIANPELYARNENENICKDGRRLWMSWTNKAICDEDGNAYEFLSVGNDITAQRQIKIALHESEEKYRTLLNDSTDAILLADDKGTIFEANKQAETLLGYTARELTGMKFAALHPEQERNSVIALVTETLLPQGTWALHDVPLLKKDGTLVPADISGRFIEYAGRRVILGIVRDITQRKAAAAELATYRLHLEELVAARTAELTALNLQLQQEIEERQKTEVALRRSEEQFRSVIETSSDAIVTADSRGNIVLWNKGAETIYGYTAAEALHTPFLAMVPEQLRGPHEQKFIELLSAAHAGVIIKKSELRGRRKDGSEFPTEGSAALWKTSDGAFITTTVRDITERKAAEELLIKNKEFYQTILENIGTGVVVTDKDDCLTYLNKGMEKIAGVPREQWPSGNILSCFSEETLRFFAPHYLRARDTVTPAYYDSVPIVTLSGRHTLQSGWLVPMVKDGAFDRMICTVEDVTEQKRAEEALRRSEEQLRSVIENASDAIVTADSSGNIVLWNKAAEKIFGYTAGEMLNKPFIHIMPEQLQESHWHQFTTFLAEGKLGVIVSREELNARRKDGSEFPVEGSASLWNTSDGVFITSLIRDTTERKRVEDLIKKVNDCLLSFSADPDTNIQLIIEAAGTIFDGTSASYHKKRGDLLHIAASWNLPAEYMRAPQLSARRFDKLCAHYGDGPFVINNPKERRRIPENSPMLQLGFKDFIATPITLEGTLIGSLNVAYREPKTFSPNELNIFSILTKAISIEEERKKVLEDLKQHQLKLKNSEKSLKAFSGRILSIREEEKKNISSALHDEIGSMVIAISSGLAIAKEDIIENSLDPALKSIELTETALKQAVDNLKKIAIDLRPPNLDIVGLSNALKNFFLDIARQANIVIDFSAEVADKKIDDAAAIVLYRTAQEALNNVVKHAKANAVSIRLHEEKSNILFEIADNGRGFNPESPTAPSRAATKIGIQGMRERIAALDGTFIIESAPQKGTTLHITIPKRKGKKS